MAQGVRALATKPNNLDSVPEIHTQKERTDSQNLPSDLHMYTVACMYSTHTHKNVINFFSI